MNDTTDSPSKRRNRPRKPLPPRSETCRREGCGRPVTAQDRAYCTGLCRGITRELGRTERICQAIGPGAGSAELWAAFAAVGDAWTEYLGMKERIDQAAAEVGITEAQWRAVRDGS